MKTIPIEELRHHLARFIAGDEPYVVTRYGKPVGVLYPLPDASQLAPGKKPGRKKEPAKGDAILDQKQLALFETVRRTLRGE